MVLGNVVENEKPLSRRRFFYKFISPTIIKVEDELTIFNDNLIDPLPEIVLPLPMFLPFLHIYDSNGEELEFQGYSEESGFIVVYFPQSRLILPQTYRTIKMNHIFQYKIKEEKNNVLHDEKQEYYLFGKYIKKERSEVILISPLNKNCTTYVYIDYPEEYEKVVESVVVDEKYDKKLDPALEVSDGGDKFIHITAQADPNENYIMTIVSYSIPNYVYNWSTVGSLIGAAGILAIPVTYLFYHTDSTYMGIIIAWSIFTITAMTIIKGWLFTKIWNDTILKIQDWFYRAVSYIITLESLTIITCYALWH